MRDLRELLLAFGRTCASGQHAALATVVRVVGSAYRRPGARMLLAPDGERVGLVSGGCLEADLAERARPVLETGQAITVTYDARTDEDLIFGLGLGCEGMVEVLVERVPERRDGGHLAWLLRVVQERQRMALATVFRSGGGIPIGSRFRLIEGEVGVADFADDGLVESLGRCADAVLRSGRHQNVTLQAAGGPVEALIELVTPFQELVVLGAGPDARPLVQFANELGFDVTVVDHRPAFAKAEHFPGARRVLVCEPGHLLARVGIDPDCAVIVMSHAYDHDRGYLAQLLGRPLRYLGMLGPRRRTERLLDELAAQGLVATRADRGRIHAPVGLDIGAETPEEIALSVLAEIRAVLAGRSGGSLRDRDQPIHGEVG
jgi:xanthine dehydrogenase accessory factor